MIPKEINKDHIIRALEEIDFTGTPPEHESTRWVLRYEDKSYSPKYVISIAGKYALGEVHSHIRFSGGTEANQFLETRGFTILPISKSDDSAIAYWAFLATPKDYNIEAAISDFTEDYWVVKNKKVKKGDLCVIWKAKATSNHRGIVALAEVLDDPVEMFEQPASIKYWVGKYEPSLENRVRVKYCKYDTLPIWLDDDNTGILASLSVSRATGGSIFKITPEQWEKLSDLIEFNGSRIKLSNRALLKPVGKSQYQDGVRINKEFHDLFNPPNSNEYVCRGRHRNILVDFNGKEFKAQYVFEGTKVSDRDLQRIQFSHELKTEFAKVFPTASGYFNIKLGNNLSHFIFSYDSVDEATYISGLVDEIQKSRKDTREARLKRLASAAKKPETLQVVTVSYKRNADVIVEVLLRANGKCEYCSSNAPFIRRLNGSPYLEVHHKVPLGEGGEDTVDNAIAVCPNCHRKLHFG